MGYNLILCWKYFWIYIYILKNFCEEEKRWVVKEISMIIYGFDRFSIRDIINRDEKNKELGMI